MYIEIITLLAVISLALILAIYNRRQADALRGVERMTKDFLAIQIRDRREKRKGLISELDTVAWLTKIINARLEKGVAIGDILRVFEDLSAVDIATSDTRRIVVSTKPKATLKHYDRKNRSKGGESAKERIATFAAPKPVLGKRLKTLEINMVEESEWFDLEAEQVGKALGLAWGQPARLWIYVVG